MVKGMGNAASITAMSLTAILGVVVLALYGWFAALGPVIPFSAAVLWLVILGLACWGIGRPLHRQILGEFPSDSVTKVVALALGAGGLVAGAALLSLLHVLRPVAVLTILAAAAAWGAIQLHRSQGWSSKTPSSSWWGIPILLAGVLSLAAATTLAPFYDQLHYHLGLPFHWLRHGTIFVFDREAYSFLPCTTSLLYTYALAGPGGWAAQVTHWGLGALAAAGAAGIARRLDAPPGAGALAAALVVTTPAFFESATLAAADLAVCAFAAAAVITMLEGIRKPDALSRYALASGLLTGLAAGAKLLALGTVMAPIGAVLGIHAVGRAEAGQRWRVAVKPLLAFTIGALLTAGPWFVRNIVATGNPVYPYLPEIASAASPDGAKSDSEIAAGVGHLGTNRERVVSTLTLQTFSPRGHAGRVGPIHLILMPLTVLWCIAERRRATTRAVAGVAALALAASVWAPPLGRYLLSTLTLLAPLAACGWTSATNLRSHRVRSAATILLVAVMVGGLNPLTAGYVTDQLKVFLGGVDGESLLARSSSQWTAVTAANRELPEDAVVLLVAESRVFGFDRDVVVDDPFRTPLLVELAGSTRSPQQMASRVRSLGVTHLLVNRREAERLARVNGRASYLQCDSPEAAARLSQFLSSHTRRIWRGGPAEIRVLLDLPPGSADAARPGPDR